MGMFGRGTDFGQVRCIINYDMPRRLLEYVHRVACCWTSEKGYAVTFLAPGELHQNQEELARMLRGIGQRMPVESELELHKQRTAKGKGKSKGIAGKLHHKRHEAEQWQANSEEGCWGTYFRKSMQSV